MQTEKLYGLALEYADLKGTETVWDLYFGIGTILSFFLQREERGGGVGGAAGNQKMQRIMRRSMRSIMQRSMLERQKKFCRTIMKEYAKNSWWREGTCGCDRSRSSEKRL